MANDDSTLTISRVINANPQALFKALTNQEIMKQWFFASTDDGWSASVENDPREGGSFKVDMHGPDESYPHEGIYKEIVPNEKIVFTWNSHLVSDTVVTITLNEVEDGTEIKLEHEFVPSEEVENHTRGWTAILENLDLVAVS